ncbi:YdcF family protein [Paralcaligenes ureilyticus]|uniref:Uncharacterized SAM-binding protein YcdF (DUF218 family) n=1 Tax=Paralcaligenes ureilyticus TaxID=627131 RepID=A0A4R3MC63_9BURK|nr:YdcF family protein [Paralcaligenes ureilyticus]TCT09055.1 uncharacterized SAM-binding protein YcdF (DUF218 family) [Paralcaligenes ureilyticus]
MSLILTKVISQALLLPLNFLILLVISYFLLKGKYKKSGQMLFALSIAALSVLSMPVVSDKLVQSLEIYPAIQGSETHGAQAMVVLGGGINLDQPEYQASSLSPEGLQRVTYAAYLYQKTHLPILVTGGSPFGGEAEADVMQRELTQIFNVPVKWVESKSDNTMQNAQMSWGLVHKEGITQILLITHAWHMRRAKTSFERAGFTVIPAPTVFQNVPRNSVLKFIPQARALNKSNIALHEWIGIAWYKLSGS